MKSGCDNFDAITKIMMRERDAYNDEKRKLDAFYEDRIDTLKEIIKGLILGLGIGFLVALLGGCGAAQTPNLTTEQSTETEISEYPAEDTHDISHNEAATDSVHTAGETDTIIEITNDDEPVIEHAATTHTWHASTKDHDPHVDLILKYEDGALYNFNHTVATGFGSDFSYWKPVELEFGIIASVIDNDSVSVRPYNYGSEHVYVTTVVAERDAGDYENLNPWEEYIIDGYSACENGAGRIKVRFSNGEMTSVAVLKQDDKLYMANIAPNEYHAEGHVRERKEATDIMEQQNMTMEHALYTDNIYYPIAPRNESEKTDVAYWIKKSSALIEPDWTDMHKVLAFYDFCVDNFMYDRWIANQNRYSRWNLYKDFSGAAYISATNVGICEDFSNVMAIMCRAQNIPAYVVSSDIHAWNIVYIKDYNRWIPMDITADIPRYVTTEDTKYPGMKETQRYFSIDNTYLETKKLTIGNSNDMAVAGLTYPWQ